MKTKSKIPTLKEIEENAYKWVADNVIPEGEMIPAVEIENYAESYIAGVKFILNSLNINGN